MGINLYNNNKHIDFKRFYTENGNASGLNYVTLQDIKNEKDSVVEKLCSGHYENLSGKNVRLCLSNGKYVSEMKEYDGGVYHGITDAKEMYEEQMNTLHYFLGDDLENRFLVDANASITKPKNNGGEKISDVYYTNDEIIEYIENGTYSEVFGGLPDMYYLGNAAAANGESEDDKRYCLTGSGCYINSPVIKGKYLELQDTICEDPIDELESIAVYFPDESNLFDIYELGNGSISIKEAIDFVEYYWAECIPYDTTENVTKKVRKVDVFQLKNGKYCLRFETTKEFMGLMFEYEYPMPNNGALPASETEMGVEVMVDVDDIDEFLGVENVMKIERTGESSDKMVSMESALDKISDTIGSNSKYEIESMEMIYRQKIKVLGSELTGIPCWLVRGKNKSNDVMTRFYVGLLDGRISYETE